MDGAMHACSFNVQCKKINKEVDLHGKPVDAKDNYIAFWTVGACTPHAKDNYNFGRWHACMVI